MRTHTRVVSGRAPGRFVGGGRLHLRAVGCGGLCLALLGLGPLAGADEPAASTAVRQLRLCDFETPVGGLNPGAEFPGAQGRFTCGPDSAHSGQAGGRLTFDLNQGAYVAWAMDLPQPLFEGAQTLTAWVRTDGAGRLLHCKTRDSTEQEHIRHAAAPLTAGDWQQVTFDLTRAAGHWHGANDGQVHWPITLVQIGVEVRSAPKAGYLDLDEVRVRTTAGLDVQPAASLRLDPGRFGSLFLPDSPVAMRLTVQRLEDRPLPEFRGSFTVRDWQERVVAQGPCPPRPTGADDGAAAMLPLEGLSFGAFRLDAELRTPQDAVPCLRAQAWFGVLPGPNPPPCPWVGTGLHGGHGWAYGDLRFLDILAAAGIGVVRDEFGWSSIEKSKGVYAVPQAAEALVSALNARGIRLNLLLTYGNELYENPLDPDAYARWAGWMAAHFRGRVCDFEIWNEPANFLFQKQYGGERFGNAPWIDRFVELSQAAGKAIWAAQPEANVILCAEDCWPTLRQMLATGIGPAGNVISIHPYCHGQPRPEREWFLADAGTELRRVSREYDGPERVVLTEAGWTTYQGDMEYLQVAGGYPRSSYVHQAQYLVRLYLSARAAGADYAIQYDFRDDGPRRNYTEHNFGLIHQDAAPKPSLLAVAAMTRLLGSGRFVGDASPDPSRIRAYVFDVAGDPVVAAYSIEGVQDLALRVGSSQVNIADLMGNLAPRFCRQGVLALPLTETPVYVLGGTPQALFELARLVLPKPQVRAAAGDTVRLPLTVLNRSSRRLRPQLTCRAPAGVEARLDWGQPRWWWVSVPSQAERQGALVVRLPPQARIEQRLLIEGRLGESRVAQEVTVQPVAPVTARFGAVAPGPGPDRWQAAVVVTNGSTRRLEVAVRLELAPEQNPDPALATVSLDPGATRGLTFSFARFPTEPLVATATLRTADGWEAAESGVLLPASIPRLPAALTVDGDLGEWPAGPELALQTASQYAGITGEMPWRGPEDLAAQVRLGWCAEGLGVGVRVTDDRFCQPYADDSIWQADSVQFAVAPGSDGNRRLEIGLARTPQGARVSVYSSVVDTLRDKLPPVRFASHIIREGTGEMVYEALIPWAQLPGVRPEVGTQLRFSLLVNDNDGAGRRGWLHAFDGIGWSKDPTQYGLMTLSP